MSVCTGLGSRLEVDPGLCFNPNLTITEGAIRPYNRVNSDAWYMKRLVAVGERTALVECACRELSKEDLDKVLYVLVRRTP